MTRPTTETDLNKWKEHIASKLRAEIYEYLDRYQIVQDSTLELRYATASLHVAKFIKQLYEFEFRQIWTKGNHWPFTFKLQLTADLIDAFYIMIREFSSKLFGWAQTTPIVFMASGSYARREAVPSSDVDALLLVPEKLEENEILPILQQISEGVFGEGARLAPRHQEIKWESQNEKHAMVNTSILESRFIEGDADNWQIWRTATLKSLKRHWKKYTAGQCAIWMKRHPPQVDHNVRLPHDKILKDGIGGLRELHFSLWIGFPMALNECDSIASLAELPHLPQEMAWASLKNKFRITDAREQEVMQAYHRLLEIRAITHLSGLRLDKLVSANNDYAVVNQGDEEGMTLELAKEARFHQKTLLAFSSDIVRRTLDILG